jgi:copper transport protein
MRYDRVKIVIILSFLFILLLPAKSFAHSTLLTVSPIPNSTLTTSPPQITLTFNERLEKELYFIKVIDSHGKSVTKNDTQMSLTQRQLELDLPPLSYGVYKVSYKTISADGHPIESA